MVRFLSVCVRIRAHIIESRTLRERRSRFGCDGGGGGKPRRWPDGMESCQCISKQVFLASRRNKRQSRRHGYYLRIRGDLVAGIIIMLMGCCKKGFVEERGVVDTHRVAFNDKDVPRGRRLLGAYIGVGFLGMHFGEITCDLLLV